MRSITIYTYNFFTFPFVQLHCSCKRMSHNDTIVEHRRTVDIGFEQMCQVGDCLRLTLLNVSTTSAPNAIKCNDVAADVGLNGSLHTEFCAGTCNNPNVVHIFASNRASEDATHTTEEMSSPSQLWLFILSMVVAFGGMSVVDSMAVTMCFALLGMAIGCGLNGMGCVLMQ